MTVSTLRNIYEKFEKYIFYGFWDLKGNWGWRSEDTRGQTEQAVMP